MNGFTPFLKKEIFELYRRGRLLLFGILFVFFAILSPATAKLMPEILKMASLESQGITISEVTVTASNSWEQFFGNLSTILIVFVIVFAGSVTKEFSGGTAIPLLTKGLSRSAMILSKLVAAVGVWTVGFWLCFGICYGYTGYYWDNSTVDNLFASAALWWLFSVMIICVLYLFSAFAHTTTQVMLGTGAAVLIPYLISIAKPAKRFLPTSLASGIGFCDGSVSISECAPAIAIAAVITVASVILSAVLIRKRKI